ncbi:hypothetical protein LC613_10375 [Nostoc sphaeroides CHAB 2801]|uniref:hypothetical protein n=1 Tax=Nostoc sphaeroides TaxID=446679 RepID=UPI000E47625D|nr:hypothetical protein [Nostoc sphaeroides]MCC5628487.1 hypothetical protein [Nostoc sphaeroides CHAB 2801]
MTTDVPKNLSQDPSINPVHQILRGTPATSVLRLAVRGIGGLIEWGSIPPKSAIFLIGWAVLLLNIRLKFVEGNASA